MTSVVIVSAVRTPIGKLYIIFCFISDNNYLIVV